MQQHRLNCGKSQILGYEDDQYRPTLKDIISIFHVNFDCVVFRFAL